MMSKLGVCVLLMSRVVISPPDEMTSAIPVLADRSNKKYLLNDGCTSPSMSSVRSPSEAVSPAKFAATVVLPTPPFVDTSDITIVAIQFSILKLTMPRVRALDLRQCLMM
jgi:hypothetical protein